MASMLIAGEKTEGSAGEGLDVVDPATEETLETVPRGTAQDHAVGLAQRRRQRVVRAAHLGRQVGVVVQAVDQVVDLAAGLGDGLALLVHERQRQLFAVALDQRDRLAQERGARLGVGLGPVLECLVRGLDRRVDIGRGAPRHRLDDFLGRGIDDVAPHARRAFRFIARNEH